MVLSATDCFKAPNAEISPYCYPYIHITYISYLVVTTVPITDPNVCVTVSSLANFLNASSTCVRYHYKYILERSTSKSLFKYMVL